jgi:hypothetical protein
MSFAGLVDPAPKAAPLQRAEQEPGRCRGADAVAERRLLLGRIAGKKCQSNH